MQTSLAAKRKRRKTRLCHLWKILWNSPVSAEEYEERWRDFALCEKRITRMKAGGKGRHEFVWVKILNMPFPVNLLTCYFAAGVSKKDDDWNEELWESLQIATTSMQATEEGIMLVGDFNGWIPDTSDAKVSPSKIKRRVKRNGKNLLQFCCFSQFLVLNQDSKCTGKFTNAGNTNVGH